MATEREFTGDPATAVVLDTRDREPPPNPAASALLTPAELRDAASGYVAAALAERTRQAYAADWRAFIAWCRAQGGLTPLPADPRAVALYLADRARQGRRVSTIERALAAITQAHRLAGHDSPRAAAAVRQVLKGIRRQHGVRPRRVEPLRVEELRAIVRGLPEDRPKGRRDRALLLVGFAGGFRRSELVALDAEDLRFTDEGCEVLVRRGKTDPDGAGRKVGLPYGSDPATCPVRSLRAWLSAAAITTGPVFRPVDRHGRLRHPGARDDGDAASPLRLGDRAVAEVVKRAVRALGLDPARYSGHSLRAGLVTAAARAGKSERCIMAQTGHRSSTVLRLYIRDATLFHDNAAAGIGL
jgi:site-specific recombinase XerD